MSTEAHHALATAASLLFRYRLRLIDAAQELEAAGYTTIPAFEALMDCAREAAHAIAAEQRKQNHNAEAAIETAIEKEITP